LLCPLHEPAAGYARLDEAEPLEDQFHRFFQGVQADVWNDRIEMDIFNSAVANADWKYSESITVVIRFPPGSQLPAADDGMVGLSPRPVTVLFGNTNDSLTASSLKVR
jgi:hypothetical protein